MVIFVFKIYCPVSVRTIHEEKRMELPQIVNTGDTERQHYQKMDGFVTERTFDGSNRTIEAIHQTAHKQSVRTKKQNEITDTNPINRFAAKPLTNPINHQSIVVLLPS